jgi:hypothetical protein
LLATPRDKMTMIRRVAKSFLFENNILIFPFVGAFLRSPTLSIELGLDPWRA